ncbi:hypothetical protein H8S95_03235 [Pontibacter sp. KCTC 32443]|uniref:hypothetical protein n=1 Tax=Pontibacter TaxID=323449 RepID=UPI00164E850F|nr:MULTISPECIES: hypothetical protein [Pontibacter]MBC5773064.1 hypothetical protein [Pontibacter sp. KCTC 32443]
MDKFLFALMTGAITSSLALLGVVLKIWFDNQIETVKNEYQKQLENLKADLKETKDIRINKVNTINSRRIETQEALFKSLDGLSLIDIHDKDLLLEKIQEVDTYSRSHKIFIEKPILRITHELLDYYKSIVSSPKNKKYETEAKLLDDYIHIFIQ